MFGRVEIDVNMVAIGVMQIDLDHRKSRHRIDAVMNAACVEVCQERLQTFGTQCEMLKRHIATRLRRTLDTDEMHQCLIAEVEPRARKAEVGTFAGNEAKNVAIPFDHGVQVGGANIHVIKGNDGH